LAAVRRTALRLQKTVANAALTVASAILFGLRDAGPAPPPAVLRPEVVGTGPAPRAERQSGHQKSRRFFRLCSANRSSGGWGAATGDFWPQHG